MLLSQSVPVLALLTVLLALAGHWLTRFITRGKFPLVCAPRNAFVERWGVYVDADPSEPPNTSINGKRTNFVMKSLAYLLECDWCMGGWVALSLTYLTWRWTDTMIWVLMAFAAADVIGLLAQREPRE